MTGGLGAGTKEEAFGSSPRGVEGLRGEVNVIGVEVSVIRLWPSDMKLRASVTSSSVPRLVTRLRSAFAGPCSSEERIFVR